MGTICVIALSLVCYIKLIFSVSLILEKSWKIWEKYGKSRGKVMESNKTPVPCGCIKIPITFFVFYYHFLPLCQQIALALADYLF